MSTEQSGPEGAKLNLSTEIKHTLGPWKVTRKFEIGPVSTEDDQSNGMVVPLADVYGDNKEADAAFIIRACNAHDDLLVALKAMRDLARKTPELQGRDFVSLGIQVNNAIAKAEG